MASRSRRGASGPTRRPNGSCRRALPPSSPATLEFPGTQPVEECLLRHRDNYGRLLVFLHGPGGDVQEHMIREDYSPYFSKYGHAVFAAHRERYLAAERAAQAARRGVWDQLAVNGAEARNYALLGVWWELRATLIDDYRRHRATDASLLDSRLDYAQLEALAAQGGEATVFTELASYQRVGQRRAVVDVGSRHQPFKLLVPDVDTDDAQALLTLVATRYLHGDDAHPRRSYAYVRGPLQTFRGEPELVVTSAAQVTDAPPDEEGQPARWVESSAATRSGSWLTGKCPTPASTSSR